MRNIILFLTLALLNLAISGCSPDDRFAAETPQQALQKLIEGNAAFVAGGKSGADISKQHRENTAKDGQNPYAVVVTCSDSRVPPEHIFSAGIGDLFVIRTAGNVVGDFELGSIEYGTVHLGAKVILVMGHSGCGAVAAAYGDGHAEGHIVDIVDEITLGISGASDVPEAENLNITHSVNKILQSDIIADLVNSGDVIVVQMKYDLATGAAEIYS